MEFLENLKSKPEYIRRRILYVTAPLLSLVIFSFWFFSYPIQAVKEVETTVGIEEVVPTNIVKEDFSNIFEKLVEEIKITFSDISTKSKEVQTIYSKNITVEMPDYGNFNSDYFMNNFKGNVKNISNFILNND